MFLVRAYYQLQADYENIFTEYATKFSNTPVLLLQSIHKLMNKFEKNGTGANVPCSIQPHSVHTEDNIETVTYTYVENPAQSAAKVGKQFDVSC